MRDSDAIERIAIIGMAGRFPGARTPDEFFDNLLHGVESIRFHTDAELERAGIARDRLARPNLVRASANVDHEAMFDAEFFGISPHEAALIDPQHRILLECAWETLENAGYDPRRYPGLIAVYAGAGINTYGLHLLSAMDKPGIGESLPLTLGNERDYLATRICYKLGLRGAGIGVQTACSTSLVAVHLACQALLDYDCDMALAGGVSIRAPQPLTYLHEPGGILSPDGHCRAFDAGAAGTVFGNGAGLVMLKRLSDAVQDRDHIYAVVSGSAVNNDSNEKVGFTAPSIAGQADVIRRALAAADVSPDTIGYVEAHGTGTPLGDPAEIAALTEAFGAKPAGGARCGIGSLKSNVGHLNAAAGISGLIKVALALHNQAIPPSLHFSQPNPNADLANSPFFVATSRIQWPRGAVPRRGSVSSFGIGGTNAHAVLEEAPVRPKIRGGGLQLLPISGRTAKAAADCARQLADHLDRHSDLEPGDVAFTLQLGRRSFQYRNFVVAGGTANAVSRLRELGAATQIDKSPSIAFQFPGQGAQHEGMMRALYQSQPGYARVVDHCAGFLAKPLGFDLRDIFVGKDDRNFGLRPADTIVAQPALFVAQYATAHLMMSGGIRAAALLGHSVGEFTAACLAGIFSLDEALTLVAERGRLMHSMPRGAMLIVELPKERMESEIDGSIELAGVNSADACVIGGSVDAVAAFAARMNRQGVRCRTLQTSHAYHTSLMQGAADAFETAVRGISLRPPSIPMLSTSTGDWLRDDQAQDPSYWARHICLPARLDEMMGKLVVRPHLMVEIGPRGGLGILAAQHGVSEKRLIAASEDPAELLQALGTLWQSGVDIDWAKMQEGCRFGRVPLPSYPFERARHWIGPSLVDPGLAGSSLGGSADHESPVSTKRLEPLSATNSVKTWISKWRVKPAANAVQAAVDYWLVFGEGELADSIGAELERRGAAVDKVVLDKSLQQRSSEAVEVNPVGADSIAAMMRRVRDKGVRRLGVVHLGVPAGSEDRSRRLAGNFDSLLHLVQRLPAGLTISRLCTVTAGLHRVLPQDRVRDPSQALVLGPALVLPQEDPMLSCTAIDLPVASSSIAVAELGRLVVNESLGLQPERLVCYRAGQRWVRRFEEIALPEPEGAGIAQPCIITGGLGGLGLRLAENLVSSGCSEIVLIGRDAAPVDGERGAAIERLRASGARIITCSADVTNRRELGEAIAHARREFGSIGFVFHLAGVPGSGLAAIKPAESAWNVLAPKVSGALQLVEALRDHPPKLLLLFSSLASVVGGLGQVDYASACAFLDALAEAGDPSMRIASVAWDAWQSDSWQGKSSLPASIKESLLQARRTAGISDAEGWEIIRRIAASDVRWVVAARKPIEELERQYDAQREMVAVGELSTPDGRTRYAGGDPPPSPSDMQRAVAEIWQEVLGVSGVGPESDFLGLGGHSLLAIQVISKIRERLGIDVSLRTLFEHTTLDGFVGALGVESETSPDPLDQILAHIDRLEPEQAKQLLAKPELFAQKRESLLPRRMCFSLFFFSGDGDTEKSNKYQLLLDAARFADANGFEAIWTPERHFDQFGGLYPNPSVLGCGNRGGDRADSNSRGERRSPSARSASSRGGMGGRRQPFARPDGAGHRLGLAQGRFHAVP
ncbi:phthiocerol/phenolphthiocerol synthesis type-I polyketide synthase E [Bradyrhizobium japonicum]